MKQDRIRVEDGEDAQYTPEQYAAFEAECAAEERLESDRQYWSEFRNMFSRYEPTATDKMLDKISELMEENELIREKLNKALWRESIYHQVLKKKYNET